jgi:DNA-directed RNA polymerase specialized sigma24 family protein
MTARFDSYAVERATLHARLLAATAGFGWDDTDDLKQELLLDCLRRSPKFGAARGEWGGFVRGVMRNQAAALIVRRHRRARHEVLAGDLGDPDSEDMEGAVFEGGGQRDVATRLDLSIDVRRVLQELPVRLQRLACLLAELPVSEVCLVTGKSRSRIYQMIRQLRTAFVQAGLTPGALRKTPRSQSAPPSGGSE